MTRAGRRPPSSMGVAVVAALLVSMSADAQYFGRNKVQYESFDFDVSETPHFDVYHYPALGPALPYVVPLAERWRARLGALMSVELTGQQPLILYASPTDFQQTTAIPGFLGEGTGGVTELLKRRIVMPLAGPLRETDHVLGHEIVHAFQFDIAPGATGAATLPLWFVEGMAEYLSLGSIDAQTAMWMRDAVARDDLPDVDDLANPRYFPYRVGHAFWAYVGGRWGDQAVVQALTSAPRGDPRPALQAITGLTMEALSADWHRALEQMTRPVAERSAPPSTFGTRLFPDRTDRGTLDIAPALSPDGRRLAFLSSRDLFSIDLYLADADSGRVLRQLTETATDPHFESLQFINSSGAFDPTGRRFALTAVRSGQPVLTILDVETGATVSERPFPALGEILDPAWSPDGRSIVFAAQVDGLTDLFVVDTAGGRLDRLTNDAFADLQPSWSPDGRTIAFVTDRYTSDLESLAFGRYELALFDVATRRARRLDVFDAGKHIDPQWSPSGDALYFVAEPDGVPNVYRLDVATGSASSITNVLTGVSGITALSPSISVAATSGALAFSVFSDGGYTLYRTASPMPLSQGSRGRAAISAAQLPPFERTGQQVATYLRHVPTTAAEVPATTESYRPSLSLDYVGQPYVVAGADPFGTFVGGGVSFLFSDMLGRHNVGAQVQVNGGLQDIAGQVGYLNQTHRINWGLVATQIPYVSGGFATGTDRVGGEPVFIEQADIFRQIETGVSALAVYPFSRASRLELSMGARRIGFDRELRTRVFSAVTGELLDEREVDLSTPRALGLFQSAAALVTDTSQFGPTGPLVGRRARLEVEAAFGSLSMTNILADVRQYVMPVRPLTVAGRVLHYGRYGADAEDDRLTPLYVGFPNLVRGYDIGSFTADECRADQPGACAAFDNLIGSRLLVGNLELRFPLLGVFKGRLDYGPVPLEGFLFGDTGIAWTREATPAFAGGDRRFVSSVGAGVRINALGFAVLELNAARPLDRDGRGWFFLFNLKPGF